MVGMLVYTYETNAALIVELPLQKVTVAVHADLKQAGHLFHKEVPFIKKK